MTFTERCENWLSEKHGGRAFLTPSCTSALELSVRMLGLSQGDEVILPSFGYCSAANAVILCGGTPVFVDVDLDTLNISHEAVWDALTKKTKAVITVHYAGVDAGLPAESVPVIEDAAQAIGNYTRKGMFGCMSFHRTKNVQCGEGGAWFVPNPGLVEDCQFMRHCGLSMFRDKNNYQWDRVGTHAIMSELTAMMLWSELERTEELNSHRRKIWGVYHDGIKAEERASQIGNGHIFWFLHKDREWLIQRASDKDIKLTRHYEAMHLCKPGRSFGKAFGDCKNSVKASQEIVRLPTHVGELEAARIVDEVNRLL